MVGQRTAAPVGVMGLSFSGGLALVAATDPDYSSGLQVCSRGGLAGCDGHVANYYLTGREARPDGTSSN